VIDEFANGVYFVSLASIQDFNLVIPTIAQTLSLREQPGQTVAQSLHEYLTDKALLLVLDNLEQVAAAAPELASLLAAAPMVRALTTSRSSLRISGEHLYPVEPLTVPDDRRPASPDSLQESEAVRLFVTRAQAVRPGFELTQDNASAVAEVCLNLDGLPLALELAAARVRILSPRALLDRLDQRSKLLTGGGRELHERQQTLRATIEWSYDLLDPGEQALFTRMGVFVGGVTLEAIEEVLPGDDLLERLASLVDKSLVRPDPEDGEMRFRMLRIVREYALDRLDPADSDEVHRSHAACFTGLVFRAQPELARASQAGWLDRLERDHDNIRGALAYLIASGDAEGAVKLAASLWWFWQMRGHVTEGATWLERALALAPPENVETAQALNGSGTLAAAQGRYDDAVVFHERAIELYRRLGETRGLAWAINNLALVHTSRGNFEIATEQLDRSLELSRDLDDRRLIASCTINLSNLAFYAHEYDRAEALQEEAFHLCVELGDTWRVALAALNLGWIHIGQLDAARASARLRESIEMFRGLHERRFLPDTLEALAAVAASEGDASRAARLFGASDALRTTVGPPLSDAERDSCAPYVHQAHEQLGPAEYERQHEAGTKLSPESAIEHALEPCAGDRMREEASSEGGEHAATR
jgi:predicted ATPase